MARMIDGDKLVENLRLIATCWSISPYVSKEKHNGAVDMLREVEREVNEAPTLTPQPLPPPGKDNNVPTKKPNEPLTLEQLREMDGEPVYVVFRPDISGERSQSWALVNVDEKYGEVYLVDSIPGASCYYDEIWADLEGIYRRPPEGEEDAR